MILRLLPAGLIAATIAGVLTAWWAYTSGYDAGRAASDATLMAAKEQAQRERNEALANLVNVNAEMMAAQADADRRIAQAQRRTQTRVQTVERAAHETPDFSAAVRPEPVGRVRDEQHTELVNAAARGADLSERIIRGVRGASDGR